MLLILLIFENTSKDILTKKTKFGKDSRTIFLGFTVPVMMSGNSEGPSLDAIFLSLYFLFYGIPNQKYLL